MPGQPLVGRQLLPRLRHQAQRLTQIDVLLRQAQLPRIAAGQVEDIADQAAKMLGAGVDALDIPLKGRSQRLGVVVSRLQQQPTQPDDQVQRRAQLVADGRKKAALHLVRFLGQPAAFGGLAVQLGGD